MTARDPHGAARDNQRARWCSALLFLALGGCPSGPVPRERTEAESAADRDAPAETAWADDALSAGHPPLAEGAMPSGHPPVAPSGLPADHPPLGGDSAGGAPTAGDPGIPTAPPLAGITWDAPPGLVQRTPSNDMRAAEYASSDGQVSLAVFHFPEMRETVRANIERWKGQFDEAARAAARVETRGIAGLSVTTLDIQGANAGMQGHGAPGAPPSQQRMLAATVETPEGFVFFKLVGPVAAVAQERGSFDALLASLRPTSAAAPPSAARPQPGEAD